MLKKRLIFTLLYQKNGFYLSRNFSLQRVGGVEWLENNYKFSSIAKSIDELMILNVSRSKVNSCFDFASAVSLVASNCFMPLALGGCIRSHHDAEYLINSGADKLVINTALAHSPDLVKDLVTVYGSQCIVAAVDYRFENGCPIVYTHQGKCRLDYAFEEYISRLEEINVGEIHLNSIDRDGTGQGFCVEILDFLSSHFYLPVILAGGAGNKYHLCDGLQRKGVDAVATANLFNFIGDGLPLARAYLLDQEIPMARW